MVRRTDDFTPSCGRARPRFSRNGRDQTPPARTTEEQPIVPCSVTTPDTRPPWRSMLRTAVPSRMSAPQRRASRPIAGTAFHGSARASLGELVGARMVEPRRALGHLGLVLDQVGDATDRVADILVQLRQQLLPEPCRLDHQGEFARIAALLADPAPVARRLLARHRPLLADHDPHAALGEEQRRADTRDAAADDDDIRLGRKRLASGLAAVARGGQGDGGLGCWHAAGLPGRCPHGEAIAVPPDVRCSGAARPADSSGG